jgi:hypothetical protein
LDLLLTLMIKSFSHLSLLVAKRLPQSLLVGMVSTLSLLMGVAPSQDVALPTLVIGSPAYAQDLISNDDVQNYARSVLAIEPLRLDAYNAIKRITGSENVPAIACHQPRSLNNLSRNIRQIAIDYCAQSIQIVERNSLTISRFNVITTALQNDPDLAARIQEAMMQIQRTSTRP